MKAGFAGLGRMGMHMARNLALAGHEVLLWNRTRQKARELGREIGAAFCTTPRELAENSDVVLTMLADDNSSKEVHFGPDGLFAAVSDQRQAHTYIEMGTMSPDHIAELSEVAPDDVMVIDAPVSGATQAAAEAQLMIMAGCSAEVAVPLMPLWDAIGRQTICLGSPGAGSVMKLAINSMIHGINQTLAEAITLAEASGIRAEKAFDVIEASAACAPMLKYRRPIYLDEMANDVTFTVALARKDMEVTATLADRLGTAMPQGKVTLQKLTEAEAAGYAQRDMASILNFMRKEQP